MNFKVELLRLGKMSFTPAQGIFGSFPFGYVHDCADDFNDLTRDIHHRVRNAVKMLYLSARNNQDLRPYGYVSFYIRGAVGGEKAYCLVDDGSSFPKARLWTFLPAGITSSSTREVGPRISRPMAGS